VISDCAARATLCAAPPHLIRHGSRLTKLLEARSFESTAPARALVAGRRIGVLESYVQGGDVFETLIIPLR